MSIDPFAAEAAPAWVFLGVLIKALFDWGITRVRTKDSSLVRINEAYSNLSNDLMKQVEILKAEVGRLQGLVTDYGKKLADCETKHHEVQDQLRALEAKVLTMSAPGAAS